MNVCYHCGGSLHNWEENDEPWLEHAIWYPNCKFLLSSKGQKFVDEARTKKHERLQRTQEVRNYLRVVTSCCLFSTIILRLRNHPSVSASTKL